jgi:hypothetical protein
VRSLQENGKPQEAAGEVRSMLNMIVLEKDKVPMVAAMCGNILIFAFAVLRILDQSDGDQELVQAALATMTKLRSYGMELCMPPEGGG